MPNAPAAIQRNSKSLSLSSYSKLCRQVQKIFDSGQKQIDEARAKTYWRVGKAINQAVDRAHTPYLPKGEHVVERLAEDFEVSSKSLYHWMRLADKMPHFSPVRNVDYAHYLRLISIEDDQLRTKLLKQTSKEDWTVEELRQEIAKGRQDLPRRQAGEKTIGRAEASKTLSSFRPSSSRPSFLKPRLGKLYTYRVVSLKEFYLPDDGELRLDFGFRSFSKLSVLPKIRPDKTWKAGDMIHLENDRLVKSDRSDKDRYFYSAKVEKGIDGDTFWVLIDKGFGQETEQKLRLRGINAAEMNVGAGLKPAPTARKATKFLEALLPAGTEILLKTSKSPNHDRFVADVYFAKKGLEGLKGVEKGSKEKMITLLNPSHPSYPLLTLFIPSEYIFLNNLLLVLGLAKKVEE